ncbi:MAG: LysM peptidoglycan-binding domain-containing protein, partial [Chloroflexota bacterium]
MIFSLGACTSGTNPDANQPNPSPSLVVYQTATYTPILPSQTAEIVSTQPPLPSPSPFQYKVEAGDTLIGIAVKFGLTLQELQLANPDVNAQFLTLDTLMTIPVEGTIPEVGGLTTPTPPSVSHESPYCFPSNLGDLICYWILDNQEGVGLENVSGVIRLFDDKGGVIASESGFTALNVIPSGASLPLAVKFNAPVPVWTSVEGQL